MKTEQRHNDFPVVFWGSVQVTFEPGLSNLCPTPPLAVVVFAIHKGKFVLADIPDRGWTVPSGHIEPSETPILAAIRETREEVGAYLTAPIPIGHYILINTDVKSVCVPTFVGNVAGLGPLPIGTESKGVREVGIEELPECYWTWDPLMESMFKYALDCYNKHL